MEPIVAVYIDEENMIEDAEQEDSVQPPAPDRNEVDAMNKLMLSGLKEEVKPYSALQSAQVVGDYSTLEDLLETGAASSSQLELIKCRLDSPYLAQSVMQPILQYGFLRLLQMALQHRPGLVNEVLYDSSSTPLHAASRHGQPAAVQMLLDAGADVEAARESDGWTALHEAVACGGGAGPAVARVLLLSGAQVDRKNKDGWTPLQLAAAAGQGDVTQVLCSMGADTTAGEEYWHARPLLLAADSGSERTVRVLLRAGANHWERSAILWAAEQGKSRAVATLAAAGAYIDKAHQQVLLRWAAERCGVEAVKALLEAGINKHSLDREKKSPLHWAAGGGNASVVRLLLDGADVCAKDEDGCSPLHYAACFTDSVETVRELLEAGADATARDKCGRTPLHWAALRGRVNVARFLKTVGVDDVTDCMGRTALHYAARCCHWDVVSALQESVVNKVADDKHGHMSYVLREES